MKVLFFDGCGLWVCSRRMERGRLHWPEVDAGSRVQLTQEEFALLIGGIDLVQTRRRKWYRKAVVEESSKSIKTA
jgi:transposase